MYRGMAYTRCDDNGTAYYFSADDFAGLHKESYRFKSSKGYNLQGYLYYYDNPVKDRLVVFDHGLGGGHRSYMKEIEKLGTITPKANNNWRFVPDSLVAPAAKRDYDLLFGKKDK